MQTRSREPLLSSLLKLSSSHPVLQTRADLRVVSAGHGLHDDAHRPNVIETDMKASTEGNSWLALSRIHCGLTSPMMT